MVIQTKQNLNMNKISTEHTNNLNKIKKGQLF